MVPYEGGQCDQTGEATGGDLAVPFDLIADQNEMLLELHAKGENGQWQPPQYLTEPDELVELSRFDLTFRVAEVCQRLNMEA
jgi:hypothetical protein